MDSLWPSLAAELKKELPAQQYDTWIKPLRAERQDNQLLLVAPNHHVLKWVRTNLLPKIESRVERLGAGRLSVNLVLDEKPAEAEITVPEPIPVAAPPERLKSRAANWRRPPVARQWADRATRFSGPWP